MADQSWNPWKMTAIGVVLAVVVAVVTGVVVANWSGRDMEHKAETPSVAARPAATARSTTPAPVPATQTAAAPRPSALPSQSAIDACNQHAAATSSQRSNTKELVIDGAIGAVAGAAVGAAGGAIAGGGSGAGKGAAIGGVLGAGGGALYGVNENRKNDAQYRDAYGACMRARGYAG
jgi:uncharacterized membrane protein YraQ (UPF0718 family)